MGGLWVDYNLMSTIPGLHVIGEANFSDHGANRLGASALMQGLGDGYFVIPYTIGHFLATNKLEKVSTDHPEFKKAESDANQKINKLLNINGKKTPTEFHRELGKTMWDLCGMGRNEERLKKALEIIPQIRSEYWENLTITGVNEDYNIVLEKALRVADFLEFAEVLVWDALERDESCGAHFREEHQYPDGEAMRDDEKFCHVAAWEYQGDGTKPIRHIEPLVFEDVKLAVRSYK
jgi:succinate dehydrogenase / fumarate reductase flavoprotein subunit